MRSGSNKSLTNSVCRLKRADGRGCVCSVLQRKPRVVQSLGTSSVTAAPPETRLSFSQASADNSHSNSPNVVCTGKFDNTFNSFHMLNVYTRLHMHRGYQLNSQRKRYFSVSDKLLSFVHCSLFAFCCMIPVCVYVNKHGDYGPHLDRKLVQQLPDHFGPAPVNAVLQQAVQACVDCTYQPSVLLSFLQSQAHTGGEVIRGKCARCRTLFRLKHCKHRQNGKRFP